MDSAEIRSKIASILLNLTDTPGVYMFLNNKEQIIYIGKAKNLKRRVSSYFQKSHQDNAKVRVMVSKVYDLRFVVVKSESDALLLENNLIKKYLPRYNILLKDDKTFPWICIGKDHFPQIYSTRTVLKDGSAYFGPYTSAIMVRTLLDMVRQLYPLRNCQLVLTQNNIKSGKFKVCLEFHMGNCKAPCVGYQTEDDYNENIVQIKEILKGNLSKVILFLKETMNLFSGEYRFEEAEIIKKKIVILEKFQSKSTIVNPSIDNVDIFSVIMDKNIAIVNFLKVMNGCIIQSHNSEVHRKLDENREEILEYAIMDIRDRFQSNSHEIIVPFLLELEIPETALTVPKIGDKRKLLDLSERNAKYYLVERNKNAERANPELRYERILVQMQRDLHLIELPTHIECFDNSNIQGSNPVSSCVVFKGGRPLKAEYRHFNIKTVIGPNDFASMEEVVYRRYKRLVEESKSLPQLIVIDGGKGQLTSAVQSLEKLGLFGQIPIIGIAKRLEEIYFPNDSVPIYLDKKSETLKLIQYMRDEAHRFGITFHRNKRSESMIGSKMETIPGIGSKSIELLYKKYSSISNILLVPEEDIVNTIGKKKTNILLAYLKDKV
jgi:excinuclease ABC subunit C